MTLSTWEGPLRERKRQNYAIVIITFFLALAFAATAKADSVYLWDANMLVSLGPGMAPDPFANRTTAESLRNAVDLSSPDQTELHTQQSHVWVRGNPLELHFDLLEDYRLLTLHFWNYHSESYDVDDIVLTFFDSSGAEIGAPFQASPRLGNEAGSDSVPIMPETFKIGTPSPVRSVRVVLSSTNNQIDWNNIGFSGVPLSSEEGGVFSEEGN